MPDRPNVLLVVTDTQGLNAVGDVGGTGDGFVDTPTLDRLATEGVACENAYNAAPVCGPARGALFTGQYAHNAGCWTNNLPLYQGVRTMGEYFADAGYRTAYVGKWHLDGDYFGDGVAPEPYEQEYWYDGADYREEMGEAFADWWWSGGFDHATTEHPPEELRDRGITREDTWAGGITKQATAFLDDIDDEPYFLVVSYDEPHEPSLCPPEFAERYVDDPYPLPDNYETLGELADHGKPEHQREEARRYLHGERYIDSLSSPESGVLPRPVYFGCAEFVDSEIGRVLDAVEDHDYDDTVVTFTSDHGHHLGAHGLDSKWATAYEEVVNVPLVVRYPDELPAGETRASVTSHIDLLPTLLDLAGLDGAVDETFDGRSMQSTLLGDGGHRDAAMIEYQSFGKGRSQIQDTFFPIRALVTSEEKLVVNLFGTDECYDLDVDPGEVDNEINDPSLAERRNALHNRLNDEMRETVDPFWTPEWRRREWRTAD